MRATGFEIGPLEWRAAKGDIRFIGQFKGTENRREGTVRTLFVEGEAAFTCLKLAAPGLASTPPLLRRP